MKVAHRSIYIRDWRTVEYLVELEFQDLKHYLSADKTSYVYLPYCIGGGKTYHDSFPSISYTFGALHKCQWFPQCLYSHINTPSSSYFLSRVKFDTIIARSKG